MGQTLNDIVDKIEKYNEILKRFKYIKNDKFDGDKPWSKRYDHENNSRIEVRSSDWTYYENNKELKVGTDYKTLEEYLNNINKDTTKQADREFTEQRDLKVKFNFDLQELEENKIRRYLWLGVHNEGIQTWDILSGENLRDAIIRKMYKEPLSCIIYFDLIDLLDQKYPNLSITDPINFNILEDIAHTIIKYVEDSSVDGDSDQQIIVFDITEPKNTSLIFPKKF